MDGSAADFFGLWRAAAQGCGVGLGPGAGCGKAGADGVGGCAKLVKEVTLELVAQSVEQRTFNAWVLGSIPSELTRPLPFPSSILPASSSYLILRTDARD